MLKVINKIKDFANRASEAAENGLNRMAVDIERGAKQVVPFKDGHLKSSGRHFKHKKLGWIVVFGEEAPANKYAAYQEFGGDGKGKVVRKYSTTGKKKFFLRDTGNMVSARALNYFKQELGRVR